jgi:protein-tyrosine phosphatase
MWRGASNCRPPGAMAAWQTAPVRVAMVCLGNICRSPMAASVGQALVRQAGLEDRVVVESFGTAGYHVGLEADPRARAALRRRGWPVMPHRARQLLFDDAANADLVLCADRSNVAAVRRLAGAEIDHTKIRLLRSYDPTATANDDEVPDPWSGGDADFDAALRMIEEACRGLVVELCASQSRRPDGR